MSLFIQIALYYMQQHFSAIYPEVVQCMKRFKKQIVFDNWESVLSSLPSVHLFCQLQPHTQVHLFLQVRSQVQHYRQVLQILQVSFCYVLFYFALLPGSGQTSEQLSVVVSIQALTKLVQRITCTFDCWLPLLFSRRYFYVLVILLILSLALLGVQGLPLCCLLSQIE